MLTRMGDLTDVEFRLLLEGLSYTDEFAGVRLHIITQGGSVVRVGLEESILRRDIVEA